VYGAFAPLLAFLVWVYYSWWVTLAAALVSASLSPAGKSRGRRSRPGTASRASLAAGDPQCCNSCA
jgi:membrane protein